MADSESKRNVPLYKRILSLLTIGFVKGMGILPPWVSLALAKAFGRAVYYLVPRIRKVGLANLELAYGDSLSSAERKRILKGVMDNIATVAAEFMTIPRIDAAFSKKHVVIKGLERLPEGLGVVLVGAHLGNWEWMAPAISTTGKQISGVVRPLDDPVLDRFVDAVRTSNGVRTISKHGAGKEILSLLAEGRIVGILVDQSPRDNAVPTTFFGKRCWSTSGAVALAMRARVPLFPVTMAREADGRYTMEIHPEIPMAQSGNVRKDLVQNTQAIQNAVEHLIRRTPEQWLWLHRRWKARPRLEAEWGAAEESSPGPAGN